jgi:hypothetical protein
MRRREFIGLVANASVALPLAARAQGEGKVFRLGVLSPASVQLESIRSIVLPELAKAGIVEGRNLVLDARTGSMEELAQLAAGLIAAHPDAVMGVSGAAINALKAASSTVPIVMSFSDYDPVAAGFAASFARPRGNITGIAMLATVLDSKRLDILHEAVPAARRIAVLLVSETRHQSTLAGMRGVASTDKIELVPVYAELPAEYPRAFAECGWPAHRRLPSWQRPNSTAMLKFLLHWPSMPDCPRSANGGIWRCEAACWVTAQSAPNCGVAVLITSSVSCAARFRASCRSRGLLASSLSSTEKRASSSRSPFPLPCSYGPTR